MVHAFDVDQMLSGNLFSAFSASSVVHALDVMVLALVCDLPDAEGEALEEDQKSGVAVEAEIQARAGQQAHP